MKGKKPNHRPGTALADSREVQGTQIKGRLWIERQGQIFLSWGRLVLLEHIRETGSIAAMARAMEMAYRNARSLAANMNRLAGEGLVARSFGGLNAGKAWLNPAGEADKTQFWELSGKFREWKWLKDQEI